MNRKRRTIEQFVERAVFIHGNKYDYSKSIYSGCTDKIEIICPQHGSFWQTSGNHLAGKGCMKCGFQSTASKRTSNLSDFIRKAEKIHGSEYDYSKSKYISCHEKIEIICKIHGSFWQDPHHHLRGQGCSECGAKYVIELNKKDCLGIDVFVERANKIHDNKYNYSKSIYKKSGSKLEIVCPIHGSFFQKPNHHLGGSGCPKCSDKINADKKRMGLDQFISKANKLHGNRYDYSFVEYKTSPKKVKIICKKHGLFYQAPNSHLSGAGCPKCMYKNEAEVGNILDGCFCGWVIYHNKTIRIGRRTRRFDYFLEKDGIKIVVEYDGKQHFVPTSFSGNCSKEKTLSNFQNQKRLDKLDYHYCKYHDILLHRIKYNEDKEKSIMKLKEKIKALEEIL